MNTLVKSVRTFGLPVALLFSLAVHAQAQTPLLDVKTSAGDSVLHVNDDGGFLVQGTYHSGTGTIPVEGAGTRLMWYPEKAAFRAGHVYGTQWDEANIGTFSAAFGSGLASGSSSAAFGSGQATGGSSFATGSSTASGPGATALGVSSSAAGDYSFAAGRDASAGEYSSIAIGLNATADFRSAVALGEGAAAGAYGGVALGMGATVGTTGTYALAGPGNTADGAGSVALGYVSTSSGDRSVAIGNAAAADGYATVAIGYKAVTTGQGGVAINADYTGSGTGISAGSDQFVVRAREVWFGDASSVTIQSGAFISTATGGYLSTGGTWVDASSRTFKENFQPVDAETVLDRVAALPVTRWNYKAEGDDVEHIGPVAEDFHAAFGLGADDKHIAALDVGGVSLLAIQALEERTHELEAENEALRDENAALEERLAEIERRVERLEALLTDLAIVRDRR